MTFFLLKWIFNSVKEESPSDDPKLKGKPYVTKKSLVEQLKQNEEVMNALEYKDIKVLQHELKTAVCTKDGCLTWEDFLNFFFLKDQLGVERAEYLTSGKDWWNSLDHDGKEVPTENTPTKKKSGSDMFDSLRGSSSGKKKLSKRASLLDEFKEVEMTPALKLLQESRRVKTEEEVEEEFKNMQKRKELEGELGFASPSGDKKKKRTKPGEKLDG